MYRKYFVFIDDGEEVFKVAIAAANEKAAKAWCAGNGEVISVKDVTDDYHIEIDRVRAALEMARFEKYEKDFICRCLTEFGVAD